MYRSGPPHAPGVSSKRKRITCKAEQNPVFSRQIDLVLIEKPIRGIFRGMNWYAAHELRIPFPYSKDTILIQAGLDQKQAKWTIAHEMREARLMESGLSYQAAHLRTTVDMKDYDSLEEASVKEKAFLDQAKQL